MADTTFAQISTDAPNVYIAAKQALIAERNRVLGEWGSPFQLPQRNSQDDPRGQLEAPDAPDRAAHRGHAAHLRRPRARLRGRDGRAVGPGRDGDRHRGDHRQALAHPGRHRPHGAGDLRSGRARDRGNAPGRHLRRLRRHHADLARDVDGDGLRHDRHRAEGHAGPPAARRAHLRGLALRRRDVDADGSRSPGE